MSDIVSTLDVTKELSDQLQNPNLKTKPSSTSELVTYHSGLAVTRRHGRPVRTHRLRTHRVELTIKRGGDILGASIAALLLSPLLIAIALIVGLSSRGGVLFVQEREGFLGRRFRIYKFRTLYAEASDQSGVSQVGTDDRRVTRVGRILRRTSLDELPQLINILKGDMSLVGPRPHVPEMLAAGRRYDKLVPYYGLRHFAKPGLTGWAQANGLRGPTDDPALSRSRIDHDIAYIANFSILLDVRILLITAWSEIRRLGRGS